MAKQRRKEVRQEAVQAAKKKSRASRKPLKRMSAEERHKRLLKKDRTYNELEDRMDLGIVGRAMVADELKGGKDPGSMELKARQYLKILEEGQKQGSLRGSGPTFQRTPVRETTKGKARRGYEDDPKGAPPVGWNKRKRDQV
jgi:hypothetical protein